MDEFIKWFIGCSLAFFLGMAFCATAILPTHYSDYVRIKDLCQRAGFPELDQCFTNLKERGLHL